MIEVSITARQRQADEEAEQGHGMIGDGRGTPTRRPESARPKSLWEAKSIPIKQLLWDEDNVIYELDDPPVAAAAAATTNQNNNNFTDT